MQADVNFYDLEYYNHVLLLNICLTISLQCKVPNFTLLCLTRRIGMQHLKGQCLETFYYRLFA